MLRARGERPRSSRAADERDDLALFRSSEATPRVPKKAIRKKNAKWAEGAKAVRKKKPPLVPEVMPEPAAQPFRLHVVEDTPSPDSGRVA